MRKFKIVFYIIYFGFIVTSVYFAMNTDAMFKQFGMFSFLKFLQYWGAFGMLLLLFEWIVENIHLFQVRRKNKKLEKEVMSLKSELYEMQKKVMSTNEPTPVEAPSSVQLAPPDKSTANTDDKNDAE
ncbi:MAG: hypothetical protein RIC80_05470 [Cyclobacteriaceae bacterium]